MKLTIETSEPTTIQSAQSTAETSTDAGAALAQTGPLAKTTSTQHSDLLARAAAAGATNAGPAPALNLGAIGPAPIAASVGGDSPLASMPTSSAGAPPPHVNGSKGGCK